MHADAEDRLRRGVAFVENELKRLGCSPVYSVGFEMLVPALLELLEEKEGNFFGISRLAGPFPETGRQALQGTLTCSRPNAFNSLALLEALSGDNNFSYNSLRIKLYHANIMASPSATAMKCESWDNSAEAYLRLAISYGSGHSSDGVLSAFPSTNYELIWIHLVVYSLQ